MNTSSQSRHRAPIRNGATAVLAAIALAIGFNTSALAKTASNTTAPPAVESFAPDVGSPPSNAPDVVVENVADGTYLVKISIGAEKMAALEITVRQVNDEVVKLNAPTENAKSTAALDAAASTSAQETDVGAGTAAQKIADVNSKGAMALNGSGGALGTEIVAGTAEFSANQLNSAITAASTASTIINATETAITVNAMATITANENANQTTAIITANNAINQATATMTASTAAQATITTNFGSSGAVATFEADVGINSTAFATASQVVSTS